METTFETGELSPLDSQENPGGFSAISGFLGGFARFAMSVLPPGAIKTSTHVLFYVDGQLQWVPRAGADGASAPSAAVTMELVRKFTVIVGVFTAIVGAALLFVMLRRN
jgi:hypothetical protein